MDDLKLINDLDYIIEQIDNKYNEGLGLISLEMYVETGNTLLLEDMRVKDILTFYSIDEIKKYLQYKKEDKGSKVIVKRKIKDVRTDTLENFTIDINK